MDDLEVSTIRQWADAGFQMYNVTAGSQGKGNTFWTKNIGNRRKSDVRSRAEI